MSIEELTILARLIYGDVWKTQLAKESGINRKTLYRYLSGEINISPNMERFLNIKLREKHTALEEALRGIK